MILAAAAHTPTQAIPSVWGAVAGMCVLIVFLRLLWGGRVGAFVLLVLALIIAAAALHGVRTPGPGFVQSAPEVAEAEVAQVEDPVASQPAPLVNLPAGPVPAVAAGDASETTLPAAVDEEPSGDAAPQPAAGQQPASGPQQPSTDAQKASEAQQASEAPKSIAAQAASDSQTPGEPRPEWVGKPGRLLGGKYEVAVKSGLYVTVAECQRALEAAERAAVVDYVESYLREGAGKLVAPSDEYIHGHLEQGQFLETVHSSIGNMQQLHALLMIDDDARHDFRLRWRAALVRQRLWLLGGGGALLLAVVASAFTYLVATGRPEPAGASR